MVENDASLHRCVDDFLRRAEDLLATGYSRPFIVQALHGAMVKLSGEGQDATVTELHPAP